MLNVLLHTHTHAEHTEKERKHFNLNTDSGTHRLAQFVRIHARQHTYTRPLPTPPTNAEEEADSPNCSFFGYGLLVIVQHHLHLFAVAPPMHPRKNNSFCLLSPNSMEMQLN